MGEAAAEKPDELTTVIGAAKTFLLTAFKGENIEDIELEEVQPPEYGSVWHVTFGFHRRKDYIAARSTNDLVGNSFLQAAAAAAVRPRRSYKVVTVDISGQKPSAIVNKKDD